MRRWAITAVTAFVLLGALPGCLSLGGKIEMEDPETQSRLESLEARVSSLEQATGVRR
jgi:hypothetical protein